MQTLHLTQAIAIMRKNEPFDLRVWKKNGEIVDYRNAVQISEDHRHGNRRLKLLDSRLMRTVRDVTIFEINNIEVYL